MMDHSAAHVAAELPAVCPNRIEGVFMRYSRRIVLALLPVFALAQFAAAQVLDQVPEGALVVAKVRNLAETNTKLAGFFKDLGVDQLSPDLADPLAAIKKKLGIQQGMDETGELAFVFVDPSVSGADEEHSMLILVPVTDYKAFTGNFPEAKTEGDFTEAKLGQDNDTSYITPWGKFAAISPSKDLLTKKPTGGVKLGGLAAKELANKDAIFYVNMAGVRKVALPKLKEEREKLVDEATRNLDGDKQKYVPAVKALVNQVLNVAEGYLNDSNALTYGVSFVKTGISGTLMTEFEPGTYSGDLVKKVKNSNGALVEGLPNTKYIAFGGGVGSPEVSAQIINDFTAPIMKEVSALGDEGKAITAYVDSLKKMTVAIKGATFGMLVPSGMLGQDSIFQIVETIQGDSKAIGDAQKALFDNQQEVMKIVQPNSELQQKTTFTPAVKTVDGVTLDQAQTEFSGDPNNPQAAQMQQMMTMMYGPNGMKVLSGAIDDNNRVITVAVSDESIQQLITAAKTKDSALGKSDLVTGVTSALPEQKAAVFYLSVDNLLTTGLKYAGAMGMNLPINLPPNQPPIGVSMGTEGTAVRVDTFVPTQLVKSITAAVIQFQMQMQGGGGGGGM